MPRRRGRRRAFLRELRDRCGVRCDACGRASWRVYRGVHPDGDEIDLCPSCFKRLPDAKK